MKPIVFLLLRLSVGISMFGHGLVRLPKLNAFSHWMVNSFQKSMLPQVLVIPFSYALPFAEFLIGLLLLVGLFTKQALISGVIVMLALLFGTAMIENWEAIPTQLIHVIFFAVLLQFAESNTWALDKVLKN